MFQDQSDDGFGVLKSPPIDSDTSLSPLFPCGASDVGASEVLKGFIHVPAEDVSLREREILANQCQFMASSVQDTQTSLLAFEVNKKTFSKREDQVLSIIKQFPGLNNREIGVKLNLPVNCITGRVYSLRKKGFVIFAGIKTDEVTGQKTETWRSD